MATIRNRGTSYQLIIKLPYGGGRYTKVFDRKADAKAHAKLVEGRVLHLQQKAVIEGEPHRPITKFCIFPELAAPKLGADTKLVDIRKGDICLALSEYAAGTALTGKNRGQQRSSQSVDRLKAAIASVLTAAVEFDVIEANVAQGVPKFAKGQSMTTGKLLTADEQQRLLALRWQDVDLSELTVTFREGTTKSGKTRTVPITSELRAQLLRFRGRPGDLLFPSPRNPLKPFAFRNHWETVVKVAEVACRFHDCRHTAASSIVNSGLAIHVAKTILGHSSVTVTERYLHEDSSALDQTREVMAKARQQAG